ncbi:MAG: hypothetical protein ACOZAL_00560 [Patescibacteria group bacterium]
MKIKIVENLKKKMLDYIMEEVEPFRGWFRQLQGYGANRLQEDISPVRTEKLKKAFEFWEKDPVAHRGIDYKRVYCLGKGLKFDSPIPKVKELLDEFWDKNNLDLGHIELTDLLFLDGEFFLDFPSVEQGQIPEFLCITSDEITYIAKDNKDWRKVLYYHRRYQKVTYPDINSTSSSFPALKTEFVEENIPAERIFHFKRPSLPHLSRGRGVLHRMLDALNDFKDFVKGRIAINRAKGIFSMVFKLASNSESDKKVFREYLKSFAKYDEHGKIRETLPHAQPLVLGKDQGLEFPSPQINASGAYEDGRLLKLQLATALGLPEFMLGSTYESSYASAFAQESPMVKVMEMEQEILRKMFTKLFRFVIKMMVDVGTLEEEYSYDKIKEDGTTETITDKTENLFSIILPDIAVTDVRDLAQPLAILTNANIFSLEKARELLKTDSELENERIKKEKELGLRSIPTVPFLQQSFPLLAESQKSEITKLREKLLNDLTKPYAEYLENLKKEVPDAHKIWEQKANVLIAEYQEKARELGYDFWSKNVKVSA